LKAGPLSDEVSVEVGATVKGNKENDGASVKERRKVGDEVKGDGRVYV